MDKLTFIAAILGALAWPTVVLVVALVLRQPILGLIPRLGTLKYKDVEVGFREELRDIKEKANELTSQGARTIPDRLVQLAAISPRAAVLEAWRSLEATGRRLLQKSRTYIGPEPFGDPNRREVSRWIADRLAETALVDQQTSGLFLNLLLYRNKIAHTSDEALDFEDARNYIDAATSLEGELDNAIHAAEQIVGPERGGRVSQSD